MWRYVRYMVCMLVINMCRCTNSKGWPGMHFLYSLYVTNHSVICWSENTSHCIGFSSSLFDSRVSYRHVRYFLLCMIPQVSVHGVCVGTTLPLLLHSIKAVGAAAARAAKVAALFRSSLNFTISFRKSRGLHWHGHVSCTCTCRATVTPKLWCFLSSC